MSDPKPVASLNPRLLARKGGARPAMRQAASALAMQSQLVDSDDLGWNDMGAEVHQLHADTVLPEIYRTYRRVPVYP